MNTSPLLLELAATLRDSNIPWEMKYTPFVYSTGGIYTLKNCQFEFTVYGSPQGITKLNGVDLPDGFVMKIILEHLAAQREAQRMKDKSAQDKLCREIKMALEMTQETTPEKSHV